MVSYLLGILEDSRLHFIGGNINKYSDFNASLIAAGVRKWNFWKIHTYSWIAHVGNSLRKGKISNWPWMEWTHCIKNWATDGESIGRPDNTVRLKAAMLSDADWCSSVVKPPFLSSWRYKWERVTSEQFSPHYRITSKWKKVGNSKPFIAAYLCECCSSYVITRLAVQKIPPAYFWKKSTTKTLHNS